jgi:hypothetical protein
MSEIESRNLPARYPRTPPPKRPTGRPSAYFHRRARRLLAERNLLERLARIACAEIGEISYEIDPTTGQVVREYTETPLREQRMAIEALAKMAQVTTPAQAAEGSKALRVYLLGQLPPGGP